MDGPLVAIVGPTGAGKSELGLHVARTFPAEIVNCDSLQVYRHFDIGTAKPPPEERAAVPHHLIDVAEPGEVFTAGDYARRARRALAEIAGRGRLPVLVGGTGLYLRALLGGLFAGPGRDEAMRTRLAAREQRRQGSLHRLLGRFDAAAALRIHPNDIRKLVRALEVCLLTRRPLSALQAGGTRPLAGFAALTIGLNPPRGELYRRLDARCRAMFERGLVGEVRRILDLGWDPESKPFQSLGYRHALEHLRGQLTLDQALALAERDTRRYAKRQWTWFHREPGVVWLDGFGGEAEIQASARAILYRFLTGFSDFVSNSGGTKTRLDRI